MRMKCETHILNEILSPIIYGLPQLGFGTFTFRNVKSGISLKHENRHVKPMEEVNEKAEIKIKLNKCESHINFHLYEMRKNLFSRFTNIHSFKFHTILIRTFL